MIGNEHGRGQGNDTARLEGRKNKVRGLWIGRLAVPLPEVMRQEVMQRDVTVRCFRLGVAILAVCPAF